jgi:PPOX class probable F420-dependent enzyme
MTGEEARARFAAARVARLATADPGGQPHVVPMVFAVTGDTVFHAVDHKPKRTTALRRLANLERNPRASLLADAYDDTDWTRLWWVRGDGDARILAPEDEEARRAIALLEDRYAQYRERRPEGPVIAVDVRRWSGWEGSGAGG